MKHIFLMAVRFYQRYLTRFTPHCHQTPSCSQYGYEAVKEHGFRIGIQMAADRIKQCGIEYRRKQDVQGDEGSAVRSARHDSRV
jgi:uncharacterized protein